MDTFQMEAMDSIRNDEHQGDRERAYEKSDAQHDVHEPDTFERKSIMDKLDTIVKETKELEELVDEQHAKFMWDAKYGF